MVHECVVYSCMVTFVGDDVIPNRHLGDALNVDTFHLPASPCGLFIYLFIIIIIFGSNQLFIVRKTAFVSKTSILFFVGFLLLFWFR